MIYIPTKQGQRKTALSVTLELRACVMMSFHERASLIASFEYRYAMRVLELVANCELA